MNILKLTLAAATFSVGLAASASAMPVGNIAPVNGASAPVEQVRLVCNRWGNCYHVGGYGWRGGYRGAYRGGYRGGYRGRWP
jgi:hypothetical protein